MTDPKTRELIAAETDWPGIIDPGEPDPTPTDIEVGWAKVTRIEADFDPEMTTAIGEAIADWSRAGYTRTEIVPKIEELIENWE